MTPQIVPVRGDQVVPMPPDDPQTKDPQPDGPAYEPIPVEPGQTDIFNPGRECRPPATPPGVVKPPSQQLIKA